MAINFSVGDYVIINRAYVEKILATTDGVDPTTLQNLGYVGANPSEVLSLGTVPVSGTVQSYIRVRPMSNKNPAFRSNQGVLLYFADDTQLNNSLELSTAFIDDKCFVKAQNISGSVIEKGALVYQSGFDGVLQLPNVGIADATSSTTCAVLGIASADIAVAECGSILIQGSFNGLDTSGFANVGDTVYLSDTPGLISVTPGTNEKVVARIASIDLTEGSIILDSVTAGTGGGGGGGGFFTDGTGTNAGIGKGATAPTASGDNALAQGNSSSAGGTNSFASGDSADASGTNSFAQGYNVTAGGDYSFVQGYNNSVDEAGNFVQGSGNSSTNSGRFNMIQGYSNTVDGNYNFNQGYDNTLEGEASFTQGQSNNVDANRAFATGQSNTQNALNSFMHGYNCYSEDSGNTGGGNNINVGSYSRTYDADRSFNHGYNTYIYGGYQAFASGTTIELGETGYTGAVNVLAQGQNLYTNSGSGATSNANNVLLQGAYITTTGATYNTILQGSNIDTGNYTYNSIIHGYSHGNAVANVYQVILSGNNHTVGASTYNSFAQGYENSIRGNQVFVQGANSTWAGSGLSNVFAQGDNNDFSGSMDGDQIFVQGLNNSVGGEAENIFIQGQGNTATADDPKRVFIQGAFAAATADDQKVWGSNRTSPVGGAQSSHMVKYLSTANATITDLATVTTTTDKTYAISCTVVARNDATAAESASFILTQATVYNDAGTAVLVGSPAFTSAHSGGGAAAWAVDIDVTGALFRIRITGDAADTVQWCCDLHFVEVAGS